MLDLQLLKKKSDTGNNVVFIHTPLLMLNEVLYHGVLSVKKSGMRYLQIFILNFFHCSIKYI